MSDWHERINDETPPAMGAVHDLRRVTAALLVGGAEAAPDDAVGPRP